MKYFKVFNTEAEYLEYAASNDFLTPNVSTLRDCTHTWITAGQHSFAEDYFTVESLEDNNTITLRRTIGGGTVGDYVVSVSTDDGENWTEFTIPFEDKITDIATLDTGEKVMFKYVSGSLNRDLATDIIIGSDGTFNAYGNAMSLSYTDFVHRTDSLSAHRLFWGSKIVSAANLILPSTTVNYRCYTDMFSGCTYLTEAPNLPATMVKAQGYLRMFCGCTSLTTAPELPATTLEEYCYGSMFSGCTSLTTAPELPATTIEKNCYNSMFHSCSALTTAQQVLPATTVNQLGYNYMFFGCTSLTTAPEISATTLGASACTRMFSGCTALTTAPSQILATSLADSCCRDMFSDCTSLTAVPSVLPATTLADNCYRSMFCRCTSLTTVPTNYLPATTMAESCYQYMFGECASLTTAPSILPATTLASHCCEYMFYGCTSLTVAPELPATTLAMNCYSNMFKGCTSLTAAPVLSATSLAISCYERMFSGCTHLTTATELPATTLYTRCYFEMFNMCTSLTTVPSTLSALNVPADAYNSMFYSCSALQDTPQIAATTVGTYGCYSMFNGCTSLTGVTELHVSSVDNSGLRNMFRLCRSIVTPPSAISASTIGDYGCQDMFRNCDSLTVAPELPATTLGISAYTSMFHDCTSLASVPSQLPAITLSDSCYMNMFQNCSALTVVSADMLPATTLANNCYRSMFYDCRSLTTSPTLPAATLVEGCYKNMFNCCFLLDDITCYATDISATDCTTEWTKSVKNTGVFTKDSTMTDWTIDSIHGIPVNWIVQEGSYVSVTGVTLSTGSTSIGIYNTYTLIATVLPSNALNKHVTWSSSDNTIATVDSNGVVSGITSGSATITVTTNDGGYTAQCSVTVYDYSQDYFTVESLEDNNTITFTRLAGGGDIASYFVDVSTDDGETWETVEIPFIEQTNDIVTLNTGEKALFRYSSGGRLCRDLQSCMLIGSDQDFKVYGNVMSLSRTDFTGNTKAWDDEFVNLFSGSTHLVSAENLIIPSTSTDFHCYCNMFKGCTSLVYPPSIYATNMSTGACEYMFSGCTSLLKVPSMRTTEFSGHLAYRGMFEGCTSLTTVPSNYLPVMSIAGQGYDSMFKGCTSLTTAPELPATTFSGGCYRSMFSGCTSLTTAPELPATALTDSCYRDMFSDCTALTTVPSTLPATTMANNCYRGMFCRCTSLTAVPTNYLPATTLADYCYQYMFGECASLTTPPSNLPALSIPTEAYRNMFNNCSSLQNMPQIAATTVGNNGCEKMFSACTSLTAATELHFSSIDNYGCNSMFQGCTSLVTPPSVISASTIGNNGCQQMFRGCTSLTAAPELSAMTLGTWSYASMFQDCFYLATTPSQLPATTLSEHCYHSMFQNCSSALTTVSADMLPATALANNCYHSMFYDCKSLTTSPTLSATTLVEGCYRNMFYNCFQLDDITCYATDISATNCTANWTSSVHSTGLFIKRSTMSAWTTGANGIPVNWEIRNDSYVAVTGVTLDTGTATVNKGNTYTLTATVLPVNADVQTVTWSTSDSSVATVANGVITGVGCGEAIITVTTDEGGYTAQCMTTVENHVTGVDINTVVVYISSGGTYQLEETVSPSDACDKSVSWSSSDSSIVSVDSTGLVSGVTTGSATVTVTTVDGGYSKGCAVTVNPPVHATGVTLSDASISIYENGRYTLTATVTPSDAIDKSVTWTSSDNNVATVDSNGVVSGVTTGSATITVTTTDGGYTAQCSVSVSEAVYTSIAIEGAPAVSAETCQYRAICDNIEDVTSSATWSITAGSQYATINSSNGQVTILNGANESSVTIQAEYAGLIATTTVTLTYLSGATSETTSVITTDIGGNSTSVVTTVTEYEDGSSTEVVETVITDVNGDLVGSSETTKNINSDDSYNEATINYDENGDPTNGINITGDTDGNVSTQTVEYDDSGNAVVTGYEIDTSESESGKTFNSGGTNTEYYAFDLTHGFTLDFDFTIDFANQPPGQSDNHHNILTAKRADPSPWYGFQLRQSGANKYIQLGTQFASGGNTNTNINPLTTTGDVGTYKLRIMYDPTSTGITFTCIDTYNQSTLYSSNLLFPDIEELKYLKITIGNATDSSGNPFRYSNITVTKFELKKLKYVANPTIVYQNGTAVINCITTGADLYYRLNLSGSYSAYTTPITITADTVIQAYATYSGDTSDIVREDIILISVTGVTLSDNSITIGEYKTYTLSATVLPSDAADKSVTWSSSNSGVASVDSSGVVSGVTSGSAIITVTTTDGGYTAQCSVSVSASAYVELEYIESTSTGGQYIDLDIKLYETLNAWYDIAIKYNVSGAGKNPEQPTLFGCQTQSSPWPGTFIRMNQADSTNTIGRYIGGTAKDNTLGNNNTDIELPVQTAPNKNVTNLNNSKQTHSWGTSLFCAFSNASGSPFRFIAAKLYYFKLFLKADASSQGTLVRDMMPCKRRSDNAIGLLDKVNNVFYTNPSGDAFVAGPVVS